MASCAVVRRYCSWLLCWHWCTVRGVPDVIKRLYLHILSKETYSRMNTYTRAHSLFLSPSRAHTHTHSLSLLHMYTHRSASIKDTRLDSPLEHLAAAVAHDSCEGGAGRVVPRCEVCVRITTTHCNTLQHTATHCNTLATHCNI